MQRRRESAVRDYGLRATAGSLESCSSKDVVAGSWRSILGFAVGLWRSARNDRRSWRVGGALGRWKGGGGGWREKGCANRRLGGGSDIGLGSRTGGRHAGSPAGETLRKSPGRSSVVGRWRPRNRSRSGPPRPHTE